MLGPVFNIQKSVGSTKKFSMVALTKVFDNCLQGSKMI